MKKLPMRSADLVSNNIERIANIFPNCVTESLDEKGQIKLLVDFTALRAELTGEIFEGGGRTL